MSGRFADAGEAVSRQCLEANRNPVSPAHPEPAETASFPVALRRASKRRENKAGGLFQHPASEEMEAMGTACGLIFWASIVFVFYAYAGYPLVLFCMALGRRSGPY